MTEETKYFVNVSKYTIKHLAKIENPSIVIRHALDVKLGPRTF